MNTSLSAALGSLLRRDLLLAYRHRNQLINPLIFFTMVVTLFPLGLSPEPQLLRTIAPGVVWVAALLSAMLSLEGVFRSDFEDGSLEQLVLTPHPLPLLVLTKIAAHWLISGVPLLILAPLLGVLMNIEPGSIGVLLATLALGTPILSLIGAIAVALTVGLRRGGMLLSLLVLPLYIPVLIFAASAVSNAAAGLDVTGQLAIIGAMLALAFSLAPFAAAAALRISLS